MDYTSRDVILPVYYQVGVETVKSGLCVGELATLDNQPITALHYHHLMEFGVCCSGSGDIHIENRVYHFQTGDIECVSANVPHLSTANDGENCQWVWIFLDVSRLFLVEDSNNIADALMEASMNCFNGVFHPKEHPRLASLIHALKDFSYAENYNDIEVSLLAGQTILEAARIGDIDKQGQKKIVSHKLKDVLLFIRNNYMKPELISAQKVANRFGFSDTRFRELFKKETGLTFPQYINKTRLSSAVYLLQSTSKSIADIAIESGFSEIPYFNRVFRKEYGVSPKELRMRL